MTARPEAPGPASRPVARRLHDRAGNVTLGLLPTIVAALVVALVVVVDVGAHLDAASRAQAAADAGALAAAVAAHPRTRSGPDPTAAAREEVVAGRATLVACDCPRGRPRVRVIARVPVGGLVLWRVWARSIDATAEAEASWQYR